MFVLKLFLLPLLTLNCKALEDNPGRSTSSGVTNIGVDSPKSSPREYRAQLGTVQSLPDAHDDSRPLIPVTIGNQTFRLLPDTGSSTTWVRSKTLRGIERFPHTLYHETGKQTEKQFSGRYGTPRFPNDVRGRVWLDKVVVAGVTATSLPVAAATHISDGIRALSQDGVLGLGLNPDRGCSPSPCFNFMQQALHSLYQPLFTVKFALSAPYATYTFGTVNESQYEGSLTYVNVTTGGNWWAPTLNGYSFEQSRERAIRSRVLADTGTPSLSLPAKVVNSYFSRVKGATIAKNKITYNFPCSSHLPDLHLYFGAHKATIWAGQALPYNTHNGSSCWTDLSISESIGDDIPVLGVPFFRSQFVVFDYAGPRLGFAQLKRPQG